MECSTVCECARLYYFWKQGGRFYLPHFMIEEMASLGIQVTCPKPSEQCPSLAHDEGSPCGPKPPVLDASDGFVCMTALLGLGMLLIQVTWALSILSLKGLCGSQ